MELLDVAGAAYVLGVSTKTVRKLIAAGQLAAFRVGLGRGHWRMDKSALLEYQRQRERAAAQEAAAREAS